MSVSRVAAWSVLLLTLVLSGCSTAVLTGKGEIPFAEIFEDRTDQYQIVRTRELDSDGDGNDEWVVLYRFDPTLRAEWDNAPIHAAVYDAINCDPPMIQRWLLPSPDNDYLGEGDDADARLEDWLANPPNTTSPAEEMVIESNGPANTLSVWRWHDELNNPCLQPDPNQQGYDLLGYFRANGIIEHDEATGVITTFQRTQYERSQLAIKSIYGVNTGQISGRDIGQHYLDGNGRPKRPDEQTIDFMYGQPTSPVDSPYPEKAVAAFFLSLGVDRDNARAQSFLTPELQTVFSTRQWGTGYTPDQLKRVLIYSISYTPDRNAELDRLDRIVKITVVPVDLNNARQEGREVTLRLKGYPIPNSQDCEWRIAEVTGVIVTPGLGMTIPPMTETGDLPIVALQSPLSALHSIP